MVLPLEPGMVPTTNIVHAELLASFDLPNRIESSHTERLITYSILIPTFESTNESNTHIKANYPLHYTITPCIIPRATDLIEKSRYLVLYTCRIGLAPQVRPADYIRATNHAEAWLSAWRREYRLYSVYLTFVWAKAVSAGSYNKSLVRGLGGYQKLIEDAQQIDLENLPSDSSLYL
jgi:hypothetical protein